MLKIEPARVTDPALEQLREHLFWIDPAEIAARGDADNQYEAALEWDEFQSIEKALALIPDIEARRLTVARDAPLAERVALGALREELTRATERLETARAAALERQPRVRAATGFDGTRVRRDPATGAEEHPVEHLPLFSWRIERALYTSSDARKLLEHIAPFAGVEDLARFEARLAGVADERARVQVWAAQVERWTVQGHGLDLRLAWLRDQVALHEKDSRAITRTLERTIAAIRRTGRASQIRRAARG
jgi:hypothetical protein